MNVCFRCRFWLYLVRFLTALGSVVLGMRVFGIDIVHSDYVMNYMARLVVPAQLVFFAAGIAGFVLIFVRCSNNSNKMQRGM